MKQAITYTNIISHGRTFSLSHSAKIVTDRTHKCQCWHSLLSDVGAPCALQCLGVVRRLCVRIYTIFFARFCINVYSYICMCPCLSLSLSPCPSRAPRPPDSPAVLTLASPYAVGMGQILAREEMRDGINEGERGHRCQRRMRVWILSCREHVEVALHSRGKDKKKGVEEKPSKRLSNTESEREWQVLAGAWLSGGGMAQCHSVWAEFS